MGVKERDDDAETRAVPSSDQLHALLDILSHSEVYSEIRDFRRPGSLKHYGPPFSNSSRSSSFPSLQILLSKFLLTLPGLRDVSAEFWNERIATIIEDLEKAELSESYDKGVVGIRKTLATAVSALIEYPVRGVYAGFDEPAPDADKRKYDVSDAEDLQLAFRDFMYRAVYGDVLEELFIMAGKTDKLSDHTPIVQATHEYIVVNLASFMHYALILSPKGQNLLTLIENANKLVPYGIIRQTVKIGNVASMINAMMKVVLAKMSVASVTNWMGLTQGSDEGMNLLQQIISTVLGWDMKDLKSRASKIEKAKDGPKKEQLSALKAYVSKSRDEHESLRSTSQNESKSIVFAILSAASISTSLTSTQHAQAQEYLAIHLSIRDREQLIRVLCKSTPDNLTQTMRDGIAAYEPIIRAVHNAVDLSETIGDVERFVKDMIRLSRSAEARGRDAARVGKAPPEPPTVGDFVQLLKKHQGASHRFIYSCAKNGPEVTGWFQDYARKAATCFKRPTDSSSVPSAKDAASTPSKRTTAAGALTQPLMELFEALPREKRLALLPILSAHALYLSKLHAASAIRLAHVLHSTPTRNINNMSVAASSTSTVPSAAPSRASSPAPNHTSTPPLLPLVPHVDPGPGAFLARWQALLEGTSVTPERAQGPVRNGASGSVLKAGRAGEMGLRLERKKTGDSGASGSGPAEDDDAAFHDAFERLDELGLEDADKAPRPDVREVVAALGDDFRKLLAKRGQSW